MAREDEFTKLIFKCYQIIYYGTPGSGKSYKVKSLYDKKYSKEQVIRTTFHPDTDYATFVGGYKPVTIKWSSKNNLVKFITFDNLILSNCFVYYIQNVYLV